MLDIKNASPSFIAINYSLNPMPYTLYPVFLIDTTTYSVIKKLNNNMLWLLAVN